MTGAALQRYCASRWWPKRVTSRNRFGLSRNPPEIGASLSEAHVMSEGPFAMALFLAGLVARRHDFRTAAKHGPRHGSPDLNVGIGVYGRQPPDHPIQ